jgi:predicted nucleic-acid-binding protein
MIGLDTYVLVRYVMIDRTASSVGCEKTVTFDVNAAKYAGMTLIV